MAHKMTTVGVKNWKLVILFIMSTGVISVGTFSSISVGFLGCTMALWMICVVNIPKDHALVYTRPFGCVPMILTGPKTTFLIPGSQIMIPVRIPGTNSDSKTVSLERMTHTIKHRIKNEADAAGIRVKVVTVDWRVDSPIKCLDYPGDFLDGIHTLAFLNPEERMAKDIKEAMGVCDVKIVHSTILSETEPEICKECVAKMVSNMLSVTSVVTKTCNEVEMGIISTSAVLNAVLAAHSN